MRVIGIDPGLQNLGWGVIDVLGNRMIHVANGVCKSSGTDLAQRLLSLHSQLTQVFETYKPMTAAVEQTFVNKDGAGTLKLGQARGIAMLVPAQAGVQVAHMVRMQMPGIEIAGPDAADALAIAICHAHHGGASSLAMAIAKAGA